ncbi:MAG: ribulose-phosphate 3-epimerase [Caldiserica bacterium]|jgi:ribulose-phosphate 3-epimerase|nr:ribulose-phosphate 3-epimerase [Caldisericota bacterium]MDH7562743.1 ribulose-phosphate 3-epimerase [Caldisericota bacterium]
MVKISPSILASDLCELGRTIDQLQRFQVPLIHIDVMDGHFVPNITFGLDFLKSLKKRTSIPLDVHLMVENPEFFSFQFLELGVGYLSFHLEATLHPQRLLKSIREKGARAGIVLNPATPLTFLEHLWGEFDFLLLMTVNPGFAGQKFLPQMEEKIKQAKLEIVSRGITCELEVDGGINLENAPVVFSWGADILVIGAGIFSHPDPEEALQKLMTPSFFESKPLREP